MKFLILPKKPLMIFGLSASALLLAIFGFQQVQASGTVRAAVEVDREGICTSPVTETNGAATVIRSGNDCILSFRTTTNTTTATFTWTPPSWISSATTAEHLVAGGGASGNRGICSIYWGQGGGGGGVATGNANFSGSVSIAVGAGGAGAATRDCLTAAEGEYGFSGQNSTLASITATGGQTGNNTTAENAGRFGGTSGFPTTTNNLTGNSGGDGGANGISCGTNDCQVGGGGGAGGAGSVINGGAGLTSSISGNPITYGQGGGGRSGASFGSGAGFAPNAGTPGTSAAQHQGGGGADHGSGWGAGGSGIVIVKYSIPPNPIANTSTAVVLVDPRAESIRIPLIELSSHWNNRSCLTLADSQGIIDITDADTTEYKVELTGSSGASASADNSKNLRIHGSASQMNAVFKPGGESKSFIQIKRPTTGSNAAFNTALTLTIKSDNSSSTECTSAPSSTLLTATIKPYGIDLNQKNEISLN
jgi:hypothetical protein